MNARKAALADVHYVMRPPAGHREKDTVYVPGIQKIYQLRATKKSCEGGRNTVYVRKVMCMCKFCEHSIYDRRLTNFPWM